MKDATGRNLVRGKGKKKHFTLGRDFFIRRLERLLEKESPNRKERRALEKATRKRQ